MKATLLDSLANSTKHRDRENVRDAIARLILNYLRCDFVTVFRLILDAEVRRITPIISISTHDSVSLSSEDQDISAIPLLSDTPHLDACVRLRRFGQFRNPGGHINAVFPIGTEREVTGILLIVGPKLISPSEVQHVSAILTILSNHLALLDYGEVDTLTGLLNRKTYESSFDKLRRRLRSRDLSAAATEPSWLGLIDIDHFKLINDAHGHLFGDEVLLLQSQLMRKCFRGSDQLYRFGGEEFIVVLDHATAPGAAIALERLRSTIESFAFPQVGRVTISVGYTKIHSSDDPTTAVERADAALYFSKRNGRNSVRSYETLIALGELTPKVDSEDVELF